jgi:hypothetical protein
MLRKMEVKIYLFILFYANILQAKIYAYAY